MIGSRVIDVLGAYPAVTINPEDDFSAPFFFVNDNLRGFVTGVDDDRRSPSSSAVATAAI